MSKNRKREDSKLLLGLISLALTLSLVPSLVYYLIRLFSGTSTVESTPFSIGTGLIIFLIPTCSWLYFVFNKMFNATYISDKQEMFRQINRYRKHFQIFYLPFSIAMVPVTSYIQRIIFPTTEQVASFIEVTLQVIAVPAIFFIPAYIILEYVLDRIFSPKLEEFIIPGEIRSFTSLSIQQKYLVIGLFMVLGAILLILNTFMSNITSLDVAQVIFLFMFTSITTVSFVTYYLTTEPKLKEMNNHLNDVVTGKMETTADLSITSQDNLGNLVQLYNAVVNRFSGIVGALQESEERHRTLFEQVPIGVYRTTPSGEFIAANPAIVKLFGYSSFEELVDKNAKQLSPKHEYPREKFVEIIERDGEIRGFESQIKDSSGTKIYVRENARAIRDENGNTVYYEGTAEDITERKKMEEELFRKERLAILGTMSGGIAHEIRNPLGAIKNSAYFLNLKLKNNGDQKVHKHIQIIDKEINRANKIITDLLNFSRVKPPSKEKTNISHLIEEIVGSISNESNKITTNLPKELPTVLIDPHQVRQVLNNLITNAIEAMPQGGEVEISVNLMNHGMIILVKDTGTGISKENQAKIFQPLFTTKGHKGIGLGLALSKQLVELNDGSITFESMENKGTTFSITFPTKDEESR